MGILNNAGCKHGHIWSVHSHTSQRAPPNCRRQVLEGVPEKSGHIGGCRAPANSAGSNAGPRRTFDYSHLSLCTLPLCIKMVKALDSADVENPGWLAHNGRPNAITWQHSGTQGTYYVGHQWHIIQPTQSAIFALTAITLLSVLLCIAPGVAAPLAVLQDARALSPMTWVNRHSHLKIILPKTLDVAARKAV